MGSDATPLRVAVIFSSHLRDGVAGYTEAAARMESLAREQAGFIHMRSVRGDDGRGVTVSYWESLAAVAAWRDHPDHRAVQARAGEWYSDWSIEVCAVVAERHGGHGKG
ncbi:MAG: antibiotic biosynthesis monooxygenase family protein [Leptospirillia bacterium]